MSVKKPTSCCKDLETVIAHSDSFIRRDGDTLYGQMGDGERWRIWNCPFCGTRRLAEESKHPYERRNK